MAKKPKYVYDEDGNVVKRRRPAVTFCKWFFGILGTLLLMGVLTFSIVACYGAVYVKNVVMPQSSVDLETYTLGQDSIIYCQNAVGEYEVLETLDGGNTQVWTDYSDISENLINAAVAIEDKRFYKHSGVDWWRTAGAVVTLVTGSGSYGGSTITQQLIKNITENDDVTVKRKVIEIFQALEFEKNHSKSEIMEYYLNIIYLGQRCTGVGAAAQAYFGKDASELDLAEAACIISITNNPSRYDPLLSGTITVDGEEMTHEEANKRRQETVLYEMCDQGMISEAERDAAIAEDLLFVTELPQSEETDNSNVYSWFVDAVINEVLSDLIAAGYSSDAANLMLYSGGLSIYTTMNPDVQAIVDEVYTNPDYFDYPSENGQNLQSAITIVDNSTGAVVAMAGGVGEKTGRRTWNCATMSVRQPGSSLKPLGVYAPAIDLGLVLPSTVYDDTPFTYDAEEDVVWPNNSYKYYRGLMTVEQAVEISSNAVAVKVLDDVGIQNSYTYLTEKFGISTLVESRTTSSGRVQTDLDYSPLALGGLTDGVSSFEMASAYATFPRSGNYSEGYMYTQVLSSNGGVLLEHTGEGEQVIQESTAFYVTQMLEQVITDGTGTSAAFDGMSIAGKTGTTTNNYDRWFCGYSPYYTAAVWCGYDSNEEITTTRNPSALAWNEVMSRIHETLEDRDFAVPGETVTVTYCVDSGQLPTEACYDDLRGGRTTTGVFLVGDEPTEECTVHTYVKVDPYSPIGDTGMHKLASSSSYWTRTISVLSIDRDLEEIGVTPRDYCYVLNWLMSQGYSSYSYVPETEEPEEETPEEEEPDGGETGEVTTDPGTEGGTGTGTDDGGDSETDNGSTDGGGTDAEPPVDNSGGLTGTVE